MKSVRDRITICQQFPLVQDGMVGAEVFKILGPPDLSKTFCEEKARYEAIQVDYFGNPKAHTIWAYGVSNPFTLPTHGQVWFDHNGLVCRIYGNSPIAPETELFTDHELCQVLELLDRSPPASGIRFDPKSFLEIVNALHSMGKSKILAAIREYVRIAPIDLCLHHSYTGLVCILRVLFEPDTNSQRTSEPRLGGHWYLDKINIGRTPYFPITIHNQIPWFLVDGFVVAGKISIQKELELADHGKLRSLPLFPTDCPLVSWNRLWDFVSDEGLLHKEPFFQLTFRRMLVNQFLRLVSDVYPVGLVNSNTTDISELNSIWDQHSQQIGQLDTQWDKTRCQYILKV